MLYEERNSSASNSTRSFNGVNSKIQRQACYHAELLLEDQSRCILSDRDTKKVLPLHNQLSSVCKIKLTKSCPQPVLQPLPLMAALHQLCSTSTDVCTPNQRTCLPKFSKIKLISSDQISVFQGNNPPTLATTQEKLQSTMLPAQAT